MIQKGITTKRQAIQEADKILIELQARIDRNPKLMCENYGQREIAVFSLRIQYLPYHEAIDVMTKFDCVMDMQPNKKLLR